MAEAAHCFQRVLSVQPDYPEACMDLGTALAALGRSHDAIVSYRKALSLRPNYAEAHYNLAQVLTQNGKYKAAAHHYRHALAVNPNFPWAYSNLASFLIREGKLDEALSCYRRALELEPGTPEFHSNVLLTAQYCTHVTTAGLFADHVRFAQQFEWPLIPTWQPHGNPRDPDRKLRIGYVSGDLFKHAVAYFIEPVLACHDKSQFETFCYYNHDVQDEVTDQLMALADHWLPCKGMSDDALAQRIRHDGIDILVDLSGHTGRNRLLTFARKPAPVQATWIGYPGTTGLVAIDYRLTDAHMDPPGETECYHSETLIRLPASAAYRPPANSPSVNELPALTKGVLTFASLNNLAKINRGVVRVWARLLNALPLARLMLGNAEDPRVREQFIELFSMEGIPVERLLLQPRVSIGDYLALHHQIDLALDPFPYNGGTTSIHSLWMGVPVLTLAGDNIVSRCGASVLSRVGLKDFVTYSEDEYVQRALQFCQDLPALNRIRQGLRERMGEDSDNGIVKITRHLEGAYRDMWKKWCGGTPSCQ